jgi:ubiquinone/menaquinone biosynthesis C-methylase UbiE
MKPEDARASSVFFPEAYLEKRREKRMSTRKEIVSGFYDQSREDDRLKRSRHGQLEYAVTMSYIHRYANSQSKVLEVGAGTGRYSAALAEEGFDVTAVELAESNFRVLQEKSRNTARLKAVRGDATDLGGFPDQSFDLTLVLGPLYHLYEKEDINKAIDEAIRVTKKDGIIFFAFISVFGIMYANYFQNDWTRGQKENFTEDFKVRHFKEQLFTGYDISEFENLFAEKPVQWITTTGTDGILESIEARSDFAISDEDFAAFTEWYLQFCEKRELLGDTNHLLYICRKM